MDNLIGSRISTSREARGWTQDQLAEAAGIHRVTLAKYESGKVEPGSKTLARISSALGVSMDYLTKEGAERPKPTDEDIMFALTDGEGGLTDEDFEDVKRYARFIRANKNGGTL